jgi:hypothetical protein
VQHTVGVIMPSRRAEFKIFYRIFFFWGMLSGLCFRKGFSGNGLAFIGLVYFFFGESDKNGF